MGEEIREERREEMRGEEMREERREERREEMRGGDEDRKSTEEEEGEREERDMMILILHSLVLVAVVWLRGLLMGGGFSLPYSSGTNDRRPFWGRERIGGGERGSMRSSQVR